MIKVAVLDDYQEVFQQIIDIGEFKGKYEFKFLPYESAHFFNPRRQLP